MTSRRPARDALIKPLLRGWLHLVCFFLAIPVGLWLVIEAETMKARVGAGIYAVGLVALFGVSGWYHRGRWGPAARQRMKRLDHATIFVMIAGSYTPLCLLVLRGWVATALLISVWIGAVAGMFLAWQTGYRLGLVRNTLYISMGWVSLVAAPQLAARLDPQDMALIAIGGVLFTIGAIILATRWPNPLPRVLGYHEVWHLLVVAAVVCHGIAIASVIRDSGAG